MSLSNWDRVHHGEDSEVIKQKAHTWSVWDRSWCLLYLQGKAKGAPVGGTVPDDESTWLLLPQQINCWNSNSLVRGRFTLHGHSLCPSPQGPPREVTQPSVPGSPCSCLLSAGFAYFLIPNKASRSPTLPRAAVSHLPSHRDPRSHLPAA